MRFEHIELHIGETFARLTLNRPDRRNALSLPLMREMLAALDTVADGKAPVLVIEGRGPAFSAGHDLGEIVATREAEFYEELFATCVDLMTRLHTIPQPAIAKVHGWRPRPVASSSPRATSRSRVTTRASRRPA